MRDSISKTTLYLLQIVISGILMLVMLPIISQHLTPSDLGIFVLAQVYTGFAVGIANFGVLTGYERNFFIFEKSIYKSAKLISSVLFFSTFSLLILLILVYLFQLEIASLIFSVSVPSNLLFIVLIGTSSSSLSQYYLTFLKNSGIAKSYVRYTIVNSVMNFILVVFFLTKSNFGIMSLAYAWVISNLILLISLFLILGRKLATSFDMGMLKEVLKISLPLTPRVFFGYINTQLDKILLGLIGSSGSVGVYHIGQTFSLIIFQFMTGLGKVFQPEIYRKLFADKHINRPYEINNYILPFFYISIFMALIVVMFSEEFVSMFLSSEYQGATLVIIILSIYYASMFFGKIIGVQLIYAKKTHITTSLMFLGIAINVGLNIPFIINWGIIGAAWATTISGVIMTVISYLVAQKYIKILWNLRVVFATYGFFLMAVVFSMISYDLFMSYHLSLFIKLVLVFVYLLFGLLSKSIFTEEIKSIIVLKK